MKIEEKKEKKEMEETEFDDILTLDEILQDEYYKAQFDQKVAEILATKEQESDDADDIEKFLKIR